MILQVADDLRLGLDPRECCTPCCRSGRAGRQAHPASAARSSGPTGRRRRAAGRGGCVVAADRAPAQIQETGPGPPCTKGRRRRAGRRPRGGRLQLPDRVASVTRTRPTPPSDAESPTLHVPSRNSGGWGRSAPRSGSASRHDRTCKSRAVTTEEPGRAVTFTGCWASVRRSPRARSSATWCCRRCSVPGRSACGGCGTRPAPRSPSTAGPGCRWTGDARRVALELAVAGGIPDSQARDWLEDRAYGVVVVPLRRRRRCRRTTMLVLLGPDRRPGLAAAPLDQVADVTREAMRRLAAHARRAGAADPGRAARRGVPADGRGAGPGADAMRRVARMAVPAIAEGCLVYLYDGDRPELRSAVHIDMRRLNALLADPAVARLTELRRASPAAVAPRVASPAPGSSSPGVAGPRPYLRRTDLHVRPRPR